MSLQFVGSFIKKKIFRGMLSEKGLAEIIKERESCMCMCEYERIAF